MDRDSSPAFDIAVGILSVLRNRFNLLTLRLERGMVSNPGSFHSRLQFFDLCVFAQFLVQCSAELVALAQSQFLFELRFHFLKFRFAGMRMFIKPNNGVSLLDLDDVAHIPGLHVLQGS